MNRSLFKFLAKKDRRQSKLIHQPVKKSCSPASTRGDFSVFSASLAYREWCSCNKLVWKEWRQQKRLAQKGENKPPRCHTSPGPQNPAGLFMTSPCPDAHHHKAAGHRADSCRTQPLKSIFIGISSIYTQIYSRIKYFTARTTWSHAKWIELTSNS